MHPTEFLNNFKISITRALVGKNFVRYPPMRLPQQLTATQSFMLAGMGHGQYQYLNTGPAPNYGSVAPNQNLELILYLERNFGVTSSKTSSRIWICSEPAPSIVLSSDAIQTPPKEEKLCGVFMKCRSRHNKWNDGTIHVLIMIMLCQLYRVLGH